MWTRRSIQTAIFTKGVLKLTCMSLTHTSEVTDGPNYCLSTGFHRPVWRETPLSSLTSSESDRWDSHNQTVWLRQLNNREKVYYQRTPGRRCPQDLKEGWVYWLSTCFQNLAYLEGSSSVSPSSSCRFERFEWSSHHRLPWEEDEGPQSPPTLIYSLYTK